MASDFDYSLKNAMGGTAEPLIADQVVFANPGEKALVDEAGMHHDDHAGGKVPAASR
jgi:hypothetical protein